MIINHGWAYVYFRDRTHIIPVDDHREHEVADKCWCGAEVDDDDIIDHKSADGRERFEDIPLQ
jgi:hypothetical protein